MAQVMQKQCGGSESRKSKTKANNCEALRPCKKLLCSSERQLGDHCIFCGQGNIRTLHSVETFRIEEKFWKCATLLNDSNLLSKLIESDIIALKMRYHVNGQVKYYKRAKGAESCDNSSSEQEELIMGQAFA